MNNLLSTNAAIGVVCLTFLFVVCFLFVHIARLVKFGWAFQKQNQPPSSKKEEPKKEEKSPEPPKSDTEPIYYIVERKRRAKPRFSDPKEIRFK